MSNKFSESFIEIYSYWIITSFCIIFCNLYFVQSPGQEGAVSPDDAHQSDTASTHTGTTTTSIANSTAPIRPLSVNLGSAAAESGEVEGDAAAASGEPDGQLSPDDGGKASLYSGVSAAFFSLKNYFKVFLARKNIQI